MSLALDLAARFVLEDGRQWGSAAQPFQWDDMRAFLDAAPDDPRRHYWLRARGMSKSGDAGAAALALLITEAPPRSRSYAYAVDADQSGIIHDSIAGFVERTGLGDYVDLGARQVTNKRTGATLSIESSDSASAFGLRPWLILVDEAAMWPDTRGHNRLWGAIVSAMGKVYGSRLLVMTSAGAPTHPAHKRWTVAESSPHWRTSFTPGPSPWWTDADVAAATEQLTPSEVRRYLYCEWAEAEDSLATAEDVAACVGTYRVLEPQPGARYLMAIDVGTRRDSTVLTVGHLVATSTGRKVMIDRVLRWTGTRAQPVSLTEVEEALLGVWRHYGRPKLVFDRMQAEQLTERLRAGVRTEEFVFSTAGVNRLARSLFGALRDRAIVLPDDEDLLTELGSVRLIETGPGLVRLDHRAGEHDDQAVTCAMVVASLLDRPTGTVRLQVAPGRIPTSPTDTRSKPAEPGPAVVPEGEQRPTDLLTSFREARRHPDFQGARRSQ